MTLTRHQQWRGAQQGFPSPNQLGKGQIATYRAGLWPASRWDALCATIAGNREESSGKSRLKWGIPVRGSR